VNILEQIIAQREIDFPQEKPVEGASSPSATSFSDAVRSNASQNQFAVIAEIKRAVPRMVDGKLTSIALNDAFSPEELAKAYEQAGASCISVLTEPRWFKGSAQAFEAVRRAVTIPLLRKDFITTHSQVKQSAQLGADAILLIVAAMPITQIQELEAAALELKMEVLAEVHNHQEMELALANLKTPIIGINNRNLKGLTIDLATTKNLAPQAKKAGKICISESGIATPAHIKELVGYGVDGFLVGKSLMETNKPAAALQALMEQAKSV